MEAVADELSQASADLERLDEVQEPLRITPKLVRETIDKMSGLLEHAGLDTRVAWVRDLFERIDVDSREQRAVAVWKAASDAGVNRSDSVTESGSGGPEPATYCVAEAIIRLNSRSPAPPAPASG
jgi:hypothetical protein